MALPESQGGIDYPNGGFSAGQGGFPMVGDLGELAARLGALSVYDRQGTVIWQTDFSYGLQGSELAVDTAESKGSVSASRSYYGPFSLMFDPSDDEGSYVEWGRVVHFVPAGKIATEIVLSLDADVGGVELIMRYYTGERRLGGLMLYQGGAKRWYIEAKTLGWVKLLDPYQLQQGPTAWHHIKLVIDTEEKKYSRLLIDNRIIPLSDYMLTDDPATDLGQLEVRVKVLGEPAYHAPCYLGGVIVTQSEPIRE